MLFFFTTSCHLVLGEVKDAMKYFSKCMESGGGVCLDRRIIVDAADGLQKAQVMHLFSVIVSLISSLFVHSMHV